MCNTLSPSVSVRCASIPSNLAFPVSLGNQNRIYQAAQCADEGFTRTRRTTRAYRCARTRTHAHTHAYMHAPTAHSTGIAPSIALERTRTRYKRRTHLSLPYPTCYMLRAILGALIASTGMSLLTVAAIRAIRAHHARAHTRTYASRARSRVHRRAHPYGETGDPADPRPPHKIVI